VPDAEHIVRETIPGRWPGEDVGMGWRLEVAVREAWVRRGRSTLWVIALALSAGLVLATGSIGTLMKAGLDRPAPLLGRPADLWISSAYDVDYDLPAEVIARVEAVPGVGEVQPVLRRPVYVFSPPGQAGGTPRSDSLTLLGVEPAPYLAFHDLALAAGTFPSAEKPGLIALAPWAFVRELNLGQPVTVTTPSGAKALPVVGVVEVKSLASAQQGLVLYAPLDTVADLFGVHDAITTVEARLQPGASLREVQARLAQALDPAYAVSLAARMEQRTQLWQRLVLGSLAFVNGLTLLGSVSLVHAVSSASARSRRRQIGLLRAAGATRSQVLGLLVTEAVLLGLMGSGLGLVVGFFMAWLGAGLVLPGSGAAAAPPMPPISLLLAAGTGLLGSLAGALVPALRVARQAPLDALRPAFSGSAVPASSSRWPNVLALVGRRLPVARLAAANLGRERGRALLVAGALALILAMALGNVGVLSILGEELAATFGRLSGGDFVVLPSLTTISLRELAGQDTSDAPPLSPGLLAALDGLADQAWLMAGTTADIEALQVFPGQPTLLLDVQGYARMGGFRFQAGNWPAALEISSREPAVLLAPVVARRLGVGPGDAIRLDTLQGAVDFKVAGVGDSEFTTCVMDLAAGQVYFGANEVNAVEIKVRPGASREAVRRAVLDAVHVHGGTFLSLEQVTAQLRQVLRQARLSMGLLVAVTGLAAGLGVVNAMMASVAERRREIGLLRAVGATRRQVGRLILAETALLGAVAALMGTVLGWMVVFVFLAVARAYLGLSGHAAALPGAWLPLVEASVAGMALWPLLATLGGLIPAVQAARLPVVRALYEATPA
jgi:putative ABC transport system permease protein